MLDETPRREIKILMGETKAKVGSDNAGREDIMTKHGLGIMNENGELFADFCTFNVLVIGGRSLLDTRVKREADVASDHHLPLGTVRIKLKKYVDTANRPQQQYNVHKLKSGEIKLEFNCAVRNRFEALEDMTEDSIDIVGATLQETWKEACKKVLGKTERNHKVWLSTATWTLIKERKQIKQMVNRCETVEEKQEHQAKYNFHEIGIIWCKRR